MDYQAFLNNELSRAADSSDHQGELQVLLVHYHQAMLKALEKLQLCPCCVVLDLTCLRTNANELQRGSFANVQELMQASKKGLRDLLLLCPRCRTEFQQQMLVLFFERRQHR